MSVPITYTDADGNKKTVVTRPGSHDYPMLDHKDPQVAEQLRVYRKHSRIGFDELLATDLEILKKMDPAIKGNDRAKALLEAVSLKKSPVGKVVKKKKAKKSGNDSKSPAPVAPKNATVGPAKNSGKS